MTAIYDPTLCAELVAEMRKPRRSLCVECGPDVRIDEDGCCASCGNGAIGRYLDTERNRLATVAEQLEAAGAEVERLREHLTACGEKNDALASRLAVARVRIEQEQENRNHVATERDSLKARLTSVEAVAAEVERLRDHNAYLELNNDEERNALYDEREAARDERDALRAEVERSRAHTSCPCLLTTPCQNQCTCANPLRSAGCLRCCSYGSLEQRTAKAEQLATVDELRADNERMLAVFEAAKSWRDQYEEVMRVNGVAVAHPIHAALLRAVGAALAERKEKP